MTRSAVCVQPGLPGRVLRPHLPWWQGMTRARLGFTTRVHAWPRGVGPPWALAMRVIRTPLGV